MRGGGGASGFGSGSHRPKPDPEETELPGRSRKKGAGRREWMVVGPAGEARVIEAGKHSIMGRTGLPGRDLRILDPVLSYPSTILGRESAIVINLEHVKAIITAHEVLLLNFRDPSVDPFVNELRSKIQLHHEQKEGDAKPKPKLEPASWNKQRRDLPFEFVALEACLEAACSCLENEATTLEKEAHPALDKLTSQISTLNLEHVRQIKSRLVAISGRVQKVRDELEHLLDDDDDMAEMYLTQKLMRQHLSVGSSSRSSLNEQQDGAMDEERYIASVVAVASSVKSWLAFWTQLRPWLPTEMSSEDIYAHNNYDADSQNTGNHYHLLCRLNNMVNEESHGTRTCSTRSGSKHHDVQELEMLLEAYFVQIDSTLNNLSALREYVDDTEDYINIMLDDKQNHLLQMGVVLTTATLIVSAFVVMAGIFGMNIKTDLFDEEKAGTPEFLWTVGGGATGSLLLYAIAIAWCKHKRLLE
ncbi:magnesium transporter MRS2-3 [Iris pallida]|uniref:Magnesium transporter n=1 Tax=Iris pallida TaxID=29817 RepID=A0AAX6FJI7_IRIPA|nr:magnesium transporter MRS2-3 [Iris pallida]